MKTAFIIHAPADRAAAAALREALEKSGVAAPGRPLRGDRYEIETLAVRMSGSDAAVMLVSNESASSRDFRRDLHLALLYDRPIISGRLDEDASIAALAHDPEILIGTPQEERPDALQAQLEDGVFVGPMQLAAPVADESIEGEAPKPAPFSERLAPLVERVRKEAAIGRVEQFDRPNGEDALGFPRTPESMLARWRMIEPDGTAEDFRSFNEDYGHDPYFGPLSAEMKGAMDRKRFYRGAGGVVNWTLGTAAAAALFAGGLYVCGDGGCDLGGSAGVMRAGPVIAAEALSSGGDAAKMTAALAGLTEENDDLAAALDEERRANIKLGETLGAANKAKALAEAEAATAQRALVEAEEKAAAAVAELAAATELVEAARKGEQMERAQAEAMEKKAVALEAEMQTLRASMGESGGAAEAEIARLSGEAAEMRARAEAAEAAFKAAEAAKEEALSAAVAAQADASAATDAIAAAQREASTASTAVEAMRQEASVAIAAAEAAQREAASAAETALAKAAAVQTALEAAETETAAALARANNAEGALMEETRRADAAEQALAEAKRMAQAAEVRAQEMSLALEQTKAQAQSAGRQVAAMQARIEEQAAALVAREGGADAAVAQAEARAAEARMAAAEAQKEAEEAKRELEAARVQIAALQSAASSRASLPQVPAIAPPSSDSASNRAAPSDVGVVRLLERIETGLAAEDQRRRTTGVRSWMRGPTLGRAELRKLQRCMRSIIGQPRAVDGVWGVQTTRALLALTPADADKVADCMEK